MRILLGIAVLPPLLLIIYIYRRDQVEKEPLGLLAKLFLLGAVSVFPAALAETIGEQLLSNLYLENTTYYNLIDCFLIIGIAEEGLKYLVLKKVTWKHPAFNYRFDAIVYAVCVSLGFALLENVMYVFIGGVSTGVVRAFTAIPAHAINAIYMGYYVGQAKLCEKYGEVNGEISDLRMAFFVPVFLHGFYDFCAMQATDFFTICFIIFVIMMDILAVTRIRRSSKNDVAL
ncbi:MAG: PrsW family intramembrane metalloprotease [Lachnospiraceae bacterium]|nr:PrsW family intramembrane metalloprotease [Lachnospiraceae bacterium]